MEVNTMAVDIKKFYEEHIKRLTKEQQILLIAVTADEIARADSDGLDSTTKMDRDAKVLTDEGWRLYDEKFKMLLEPQYLGQVVAIDLDSEDYEVAKRSALAWRPLKARKPDGRIVVLDIGLISPDDSLELRRKGILSARSAPE
jgi:hypothetical protein